MDRKNPDMNAMYARLSDAIMKALSNSDEVYDLLSDLQNKGLITGDSVFNMLVSLEELSTMMDIPSHLAEAPDQLEPQSETTTPGESKPTAESTTPGTINCVDGRELSKREQEFEEYFQSGFNEECWMKKAGIRF